MLLICGAAARQALVLESLVAALTRRSGVDVKVERRSGARTNDLDIDEERRMLADSEVPTRDQVMGASSRLVSWARRERPGARGAQPYLGARVRSPGT